MSLFESLSRGLDLGSTRERLKVLCSDFERRGLSSKGRLLIYLWLRSALQAGIATQREAGSLSAGDLNPVIIIGLQRTGTTFLHHALSSLPGFDSLKLWQLLYPSSRRSRFRKATEARALVAIDRIFHSNSADYHPMQWDSPEECFWIFNHYAGSIGYFLHYGLQDYHALICQSEQQFQLYELYRQTIQLIRQTSSKTLVLKCPDHLWQLSGLLKVFSGARLIWCHREPDESVASFCNMSLMHRRGVLQKADPVEIGKHVLREFSTGVREARHILDQNGVSILHLSYADLVRSPQSALRQVYTYLGKEYDPGVIEKSTILQKHTSHKANRHRYKLEEFGIRQTDIRRDFGDYYERFLGSQ